MVDAASHISRPLQQFRQAFPGVRVTVLTGNTDDICERLRAFEADIGVIGSDDALDGPIHLGEQRLRIGRAPKLPIGKRGGDLLAQEDSGFRHIEDWGWDYRAPGGESPRELWARLEPWVRGRNTDTVAVCHIGIMRVILAKAYGWDFDGEPPFKIKRNRLFVVDLDTFEPAAEPVRLIRKTEV